MSYVNDPDHALWILRQGPELARRVARLQGLLSQANAGAVVELLDLELARQDVMALLNVMEPEPEPDWDDDC
jgi:hypothetical protein